MSLVATIDGAFQEVFRLEFATLLTVEELSQHLDNIKQLYLDVEVDEIH